MSAPVDFEGVALARLEAADWSAVYASAPASYVELETGLQTNVWGFWRDLEAIERRAFGLQACRVRPVGVLIVCVLGGDGSWSSERALVRLPQGWKRPNGAGQAAWVAHCLPHGDYIQLEPAAVDRLRDFKGGAA